MRVRAPEQRESRARLGERARGLYDGAHDERRTPYARFPLHLDDALRPHARRLQVVRGPRPVAAHSTPGAMNDSRWFLGAGCIDWCLARTMESVL